MSIHDITASDCEREEMESRREGETTDVDLAFRIFGDQLVMWRADVNEETGEVEGEQYLTACRVGAMDQPTRRTWKDWQHHSSLRDAVEDAMSSPENNYSPDFCAVVKTEAAMLRDGVNKLTTSP